VATFERFEDIEAWQKARELTQGVYAVSGHEPFVKDFALRDQIRRAAISVMSNIAEGFERGGNREFHNFLSYARASAGETKAQLYVALDQRYIDSDNFKRLYDLSGEVARMIGGLMNYLQSTDIKGPKFRQ